MVVLLIGPGRGPLPGEGQHEARKVFFWQVVAVHTSPELVPAQLCDPPTQQCSNPFWLVPVAASRVFGGAHNDAGAG